VPSEGYGFINEAQGFITAASFDVAGLTLDAGDSAITISLISTQGLARADGAAVALRPPRRRPVSTSFPGEKHCAGGGDVQKCRA